MKDEERNSIDKFFKAGLENADGNALFQENDWNAMDDMLNAGNKRRALLKRLPLIISGIAALLILLAGWLFFRVDNNINKAMKQVKKTPSVHKNTGKYGQPVQQPADLASIKPLSVADSVYSANASNRESKSFLTLSAAAVGRTIAVPGNGLNFNAIPFYIAPDTMIQQPLAIIAPDSIQKHLIASANTKHIDDALPLLTTTADTTPPDPAVSPAERKKDKPAMYHEKRRLTLSIIVSPDINSVQSFSQNKVGTNAGVILTMGLSKKWSVSTGLIYADKPYMTDFANYKTAYNFDVEPTSVSASCIVLDIPLNIGYQLYNKNGNKFSLGTGLSSYLMLRENYTFNYSGTGAQYPLNYNISNKNKHFFGVLNLNATYQRAVSSKFDIGIQPYLKLPLTNIGYGQVNLKSAGLAVGVMWNLNSRTKP